MSARRERSEGWSRAEVPVFSQPGPELCARGTPDLELPSHSNRIAKAGGQVGPENGQRQQAPSSSA